MNKMIIAEAVTIVVLIILICIVPNNSPAKLEDASLKTEHVGHLNQIQSKNPSGTDASITGTAGDDDPSTEDTTEKTLVSITRAKGGLAAYENGTFVEPSVDNGTQEDNGGDTSDDGNGTDGEQGDDGNTDNGSDGDDGNTDNNDDNGGDNDNNGDGNNDNTDDDGSSEDEGGSDFEWTMKDPEKAIDTGKRATTTAPIKIRSTPTIQTEDNVIDTLDEGEVLVVTDASVTSTDPKVTNWVEVYYKGKIGYISAKYVSVE